MNERGKFESHPSICMDCNMTCKGCPWATKFKPVKGWKAEAIKKLVSSFHGKKGYIDSFRVIECPNYKKYERLKEV